MISRKLDVFTLLFRNYANIACPWWILIQMFSFLDIVLHWWLLLSYLPGGLPDGLIPFIHPKLSVCLYNGKGSQTHFTCVPKTKKLLYVRPHLQKLIIFIVIKKRCFQSTTRKIRYLVHICTSVHEYMHNL